MCSTTTAQSRRPRIHTSLKTFIHSSWFSQRSSSNVRRQMIVARGQTRDVCMTDLDAVSEFHLAFSLIYRATFPGCVFVT
mmetsp:Transcript_24126/g.35384  ORF Transcript_24126/g.35384 Transcript_24126/m.35384 type:complete len:80 (+) Transcript_24126:1021-1260(+)